MPRPPYFMGIDGGTGSVRAVIFDKEGNNLGSHVAEYGTTYPKSGWAEQDPDEWWKALKEAIPGAIKAAGVDPKDIKAVTADATTSTVVLLDKDKRPVRPAILWMDVRSADQAQRIYETKHPMIKYYMSGVPAESLIPKCLWIKENEPENWEKAEIVFEYTDWLHWKLSGNINSNISVASFRWFYDEPQGGWQKDFYETIGLGDIMDKFPLEVLHLGDVQGYVTAEAARELGLAEGTIVGQGPLDAVAAMIGVNVVEPGGMALIGGSSTPLFGLSAKEIHAEGIAGAYPNCVLPGTSLVEGGQVSTGSIKTWFRKNFMPAEWEEEAKERGVSVYQVIDEKAAEIPIGSEGLILLDYFQGNRTPYADSLARGVIWGLSLLHGPAHIARAINEGVAYGAEHCFRAMEKAGYKVESISACGGIVQSPVWMQMHADVSGLPIYTTKETQSAACLGDAIIAAVAAGEYSSIPEAAANMVKMDKVYEPNMENHEKYKFFVDKYIETWPRIRDLVHDTVRHITE
ncbi:MAG: FGGY family carbohydrate kinase [bacterium]|jgi:FGGY-family pentulose kinase